MKVLFVCRANVGRSQAAMELFRQVGGEADSAGTKVDLPGVTLAERPGVTIIGKVLLADYGIDISQNVRTQISLDFASNYDTLVVMAEKETVPNWLLNDSRTCYWKIDDPKGQDIMTTRRIVNEIKARVDSLATELKLAA